MSSEYEIQDKPSGSSVTNATFLNRVVAFLLDWIILLPLTAGIKMYDMLYMKSYMLSLIPPILSLMYMVYMEKTYGATLGKRLMGLSVVDDTFDQISWSQAFTRSYFYLFSVILALFQNLDLYGREAFQKADTWEKIIHVMETEGNMMLSQVSLVLLLLFMIDALFMLNNQSKRTLHDLWAKTQVIKKA